VSRLEYAIPSATATAIAIPVLNSETISPVWDADDFVEVETDVAGMVVVLVTGAIVVVEGMTVSGSTGSSDCMHIDCSIVCSMGAHDTFSSSVEYAYPVMFSIGKGVPCSRVYD